MNVAIADTGAGGAEMVIQGILLNELFADSAHKGSTA